jgi:hypothetical protein
VTAYLVVRMANPETGSRVPVRAFSTRAAAEAFTAEQLAAVRRTMNPFHMWVCEYLGDDAREKLAALGLPLPMPAEEWYGDWSGWWDSCQEAVTDEQRAAVWAVFDGPPLFDVVRVEGGEE